MPPGRGRRTDRPVDDRPCPGSVSVHRQSARQDPLVVAPPDQSCGHDLGTAGALPSQVLHIPAASVVEGAGVVMAPPQEPLHGDTVSTSCLLVEILGGRPRHERRQELPQPAFVERGRGSGDSRTVGTRLLRVEVRATRKGVGRRGGRVPVGAVGHHRPRFWVWSAERSTGADSTSSSMNTTRGGGGTSER